MKKNTVRIAWFGVFTALALIFSYVETLIPFQIGIPGVKLGLANLIVVVALYKMGGKDALLLSVTRIVLSGFIFASLFSILYSLAGGLLSLAVMVILKKRGFWSQHGRWCLSQCRSADRSDAGRGDIQRRLLCAGTSDRRSNHRIYYRSCGK